MAGHLIDTMGPKNILALSLLASAFSYLLTGMASSLLTLYLAQIPTLAQHAFMAGRSYFGLTSKKTSDRALLLAYVSTAYSIGMVCGPAVGGMISEYGLQATALLSAVLSLVNFFVVWLYLDSPKLTQAETNNQIENTAKSGNQKDSASKGSYMALLKVPGVFYALMVKTIFIVAISIFQSALSIMLPERFGFDAKDTGKLLSWFGLVAGISSLCFVKPVLAKCGDRFSLQWSVCALGLTFLLLTNISTSLQIYLFVLPNAATTVIFKTVSETILTDLVGLDQQGVLAAIDMGCGSAIRIFSPSLSVYLMRSIGFEAIGITSASLCGVVLLLLCFAPLKRGQLSVHKEEKKSN